MKSLRKLMIGVLLCGFVMVAQPVQANVFGDFFVEAGTKLKSVGVWGWNLIPAGLKISNQVVHLVDTEIHALAELLEIEDVGE